MMPVSLVAFTIQQSLKVTEGKGRDSRVCTDEKSRAFRNVTGFIAHLRWAAPHPAHKAPNDRRAGSHDLLCALKTGSF